jgi:hypothetical protein
LVTSSFKRNSNTTVNLPSPRGGAYFYVFVKIFMDKKIKQNLKAESSAEPQLKEASPVKWVSFWESRFGKAERIYCF